MILSRGLLASIFILSLSLPASSQNASVKPVTIAEIASKACVRSVSGTESDNRISSLGVKLGGANAAQKDIVASALNTISVQSEGRLNSAFRNLNINITGTIARNGQAVAVGGRTGANNMVLDGSLLTRKLNSGVGEATVVHELGHVYSFRKGMVGAYNSAVPEDCGLSTYCTHRFAGNGAPTTAHQNRNEEFAEVFTAYIFHADALKTQCPAAYNFMKQKVFGTEARSSASCVPRPVERTYQTADGRTVPVGPSGIAPEGYTAQTAGGFDLSGVAQMMNLMALTRKEDEQYRIQQQQTNPSGTTPAATGDGKTKVTDERMF